MTRKDGKKLNWRKITIIIFLIGVTPLVLNWAYDEGMFDSIVDLVK